MNCGPRQDWRIADIHRRIRSFLESCPPGDWTLEESQMMLAAVTEIACHRRLHEAQVIPLRPRHA